MIFEGGNSHCFLMSEKQCNGFDSRPCDDHHCHSEGIFCRETTTLPATTTITTTISGWNILIKKG